MRESVLLVKSKAFALEVIRVCRGLRERRCEAALIGQFLRSGTSIGANINEANYGHSRADFISKLHIALKETAETEYWLRLLQMSEYINGELSASLLQDCLEIKRILVASINTAKSAE